MSHPQEQESTRENSGKLQRYSWFAIMLYPNEDASHKAVLDFILCERGLFRKVVWINHNRDIYLEDTTDSQGIFHAKGSLKKEHIHCLFKLARQSTLNGVIKMFDGDISKVVGIENPCASILYFLHRTHKAKKYGKPLYSDDELQGDPDVINDAIIQNSHLVQLPELIKIMDSTPHSSLKELQSAICSLPDERKAMELLDTLKSWQNVICNMSNQEIRFKTFLKGEIQ